MDAKVSTELSAGSRERRVGYFARVGQAAASNEILPDHIHRSGHRHAERQISILLEELTKNMQRLGLPVAKMALVRRLTSWSG